MVTPTCVRKQTSTTGCQLGDLCCRMSLEEPVPPPPPPMCQQYNITTTLQACIHELGGISNYKAIFSAKLNLSAAAGHSFNTELVLRDFTFHTFLSGTRINSFPCS